jgi:hypothetical protein
LLSIVLQNFKSIVHQISLTNRSKSQFITRHSNAIGIVHNWNLFKIASCEDSIDSIWGNALNTKRFNLCFFYLMFMISALKFRDQWAIFSYSFPSHCKLRTQHLHRSKSNPFTANSENQTPHYPEIELLHWNLKNQTLPFDCKRGNYSFICM